MVMGDDHPCKIEGMGTVRIKMEDGIVRELKEVRYVPQLKRNLIFVGILEALGLVMKGVRRGNLNYLKGSTVTGQVETSSSLDDGCTKVWQVKVRQGGERSLQAPTKKGSLEGASTYNLEGEHVGPKAHHSSFDDCLLYTSPSPRDS